MPTTQKINQNIQQVKIGNTAIKVEVANTERARQLGLSGRSSLKEESGMLFVFDTPGDYVFWMKDMRFNIDILFADAEGEIITIHHNVPADSYLKSPPGIFRSSSPAQYVLEVPAGFAEKYGIVEGAQMNFE